MVSSPWPEPVGERCIWGGDAGPDPLGFPNSEVIPPISKVAL